MKYTFVIPPPPPVKVGDVVKVQMPDGRWHYAKVIESKDPYAGLRNKWVDRLLS